MENGDNDADGDKTYVWSNNSLFTLNSFQSTSFHIVYVINYTNCHHATNDCGKPFKQNYSISRHFSCTNRPRWPKTRNSTKSKHF